jgi:hypothetical protein
MKFHPSDEEITRVCSYISDDKYIASLYGVPIERVRVLRYRQQVSAKSTPPKDPTPMSIAVVEGGDRKAREDGKLGSEALLKAINRYYKKYHIDGCSLILQAPLPAAREVSQQPKDTTMQYYISTEKTLNDLLKERGEQDIYIRWNGCEEAPNYKVYFQEELTELLLADHDDGYELQRNPIGSRTFEGIDSARNNGEAVQIIVEEIRSAIASGDLLEGDW